MLLPEMISIVRYETSHVRTKLAFVYDSTMQIMATEMSHITHGMSSTVRAMGTLPILGASSAQMLFQCALSSESLHTLMTGMAAN